MINLLPQKEKQELIFQKNRNLVVVLGSITMIFLVCLSLVLLSLKFYILQRLSYQQSTLEEAEAQYQTPQYLSLLDSLKKYNMLLLRVDDFYKKENYFSDILKIVFTTKKPEGVTFNNIVLNRNNDNKTKVSINGASISRDELLSFKDNIKDQNNVNNVYLPPDNLVKPSNINFSITFEVQFK